MGKIKLKNSPNQKQALIKRDPYTLQETKLEVLLKAHAEVHQELKEVRDKALLVCCLCPQYWRVHLDVA